MKLSKLIAPRAVFLSYLGNVNELVSLARAVKALNLGEDKSLEDAINARANALIGSASADDVARLAGAIKQVLNPASITVTTLSTITGDLIPDQNIVHDLLLFYHVGASDLGEERFIGYLGLFFRNEISRNEQVPAGMTVLVQGF